MFENIYYNQINKLLIFEDIVFINVDSLISNLYTISRIIFIDRDYRSDANIIDSVIITIRAVVDNRYLELQNLDLVYIEDKLFILENIFLKINVNQVKTYIKCFLNREYNTNNNLDLYIKKDYFIRRVIKALFIIRLLRCLYFT